MPISGHSVFSHDATGGDRELAKNRGGLSGRAFDSIEDLDKRVDAMSVLDKPAWLEDYEKIRKRREDYQRQSVV